MVQTSLYHVKRVGFFFPLGVYRWKLYGGGEISSQLRACTALPDNSNSVPSRFLTISCDSTSRGSSVSGLCRSLYLHTHSYTQSLVLSPSLSHTSPFSYPHSLLKYNRNKSLKKEIIYFPQMMKDWGLFFCHPCKWDQTLLQCSAGWPDPRWPKVGMASAVMLLCARLYLWRQPTSLWMTSSRRRASRLASIQRLFIWIVSVLH